MALSPFALRQRQETALCATFRVLELEMHKFSFFFLGILLVFLAACQAEPSACEPAADVPRYFTTPPEVSPTATNNPFSTPTILEIGGQPISVDKVVSGPLCNDVWSGTIYVTCDVQVYAWEEQPTFLQDCDLDIAPNTVVYVAYHNDTAYYNGCSCHTGAIANP
jgi:hypothetical protein